MTKVDGFTGETITKMENQFETKLSYLIISNPIREKLILLLDALEEFHKKKEASKKSKSKNQENNEDEITTKEQGDMLESIVRMILEQIEVIKLIQNERNNSNEIDFFVKLNTLGQVMQKKGWIPEWIPSKFLIECKNYDGTVGITYVGKFRALMEIVSVRLGLFISYDGLSGRDNIAWRDASGYIKKLALINPNEKEKTIILDIDAVKLRNLVTNKGSIFEFIDDEKDKLLADIKSDFIVTYIHPNQDKFRKSS